MFGNGILIVAIVVLAALSAGAIMWGLLYEKVSDDGAAKRIERIVEATSHKGSDNTPTPAKSSRRSLQAALKEFEEKQKSKGSTSPPLPMRLGQAGLDWDRQTYSFFSIGVGVGVGLLILFLSGNTLLGLGGVVIGAFGLPSWIIGFLARRRQKAFIDELPTAIDLIVRGVRSGLPLGDCLRMVSTETKEPLKSEFRAIMEAQQMGVPIGEACQKLYERIPLQEANFFGIVIAIQQKAGGNLSEALGNLSNVLRDRKKMQEKIQAMSMEAKASAGIIGSLPFVVGALVFLTSPSYITILFTSTTGNFIMIGGGLYMLIGILVMRQMINFDF